MNANELRKAFTGFFHERGHVVVDSASLVPQDPSVLFTIAGMVPFKPYFLGDEVPPMSRATSVQKCFRTLDIEIVGSTERHCTFFEMLGNFSFGDYFKQEAIPFAWEFVTEVLGIEADRLWVTVHDTDDEAYSLWTEGIGILPARVQRMGEDNFWRMGETGPCGPSSELYFDKGDRYGPGGGPAVGGSERFVEIWNLVFMQYNRLSDGSLSELPKRNIDTGAGLERILPILQGKDSLFATDVFAPIVCAAEELTKHRYGSDPASDVALRILADHARAVTFLVADGVLPSNEARGYVLRRVIRRAARRAFQLGVADLATPSLVEAVVAVMKDAYPYLVRDQDLITRVVTREEEQFRRTLASGSAILEEALASGRSTIPGEVAFQLHDTFGFPVELTVEIAAEHGVNVDRQGFDAAMAVQRNRARQGAKTVAASSQREHYRQIVDSYGPTRFTGYQEYTSQAKVVAVLDAADHSEVVMDRTPFYAEGGGQVGDTGTITTETGVAQVTDTTYGLPGLVVHSCQIEGEILAGQEATAAIDAKRRDAIRRNHTATHLLHWGLRTVLGDHVRQQGSLVAPDRLRFDFSHFGPVLHEELLQVEELVQERILADEPVRAFETTKVYAEELGAIAFFGDKYGDVVRVVEAGSKSVELCGGTHVSSLGMIGPVIVVSETSIGANTRRLEAITGSTAFARIKEREEMLRSLSQMMKADPDELAASVQRLMERQRRFEEELQKLRQRQALEEAQALSMQAASAKGYVVARRDGATPEELRRLALAVREHPGVKGVVLAGVCSDGKVALVSAMASGAKVGAGELLAEVARVVGGGGGGTSELAAAGGRDASKVDEALELARAKLDGA